jgi:hypothetical protein
METVWATWDFRGWLGNQKEGVFPAAIENWTRREDTIHQLKMSLSNTDWESMGPEGYVNPYVNPYVRVRRLQGYASLSA